MKAAIYNPYFDTLGGGERYTASFAKVLLDTGWQVDIEWGDETLPDKIKARFAIDLKGVRVTETIRRGDGYDLCFWVSDGSIPLLRSRKNILHFQVPFKNTGTNLLLNKMKLLRIDEVVCNSIFTKRVIDKEYGVDSIVIYPPVAVSDFSPKRKENLILAVGRFSQLIQAKRQDLLIAAFKKLGLKENYRLVLAGGSEVGAGHYLEGLKKLTKGARIEIVESPGFDEVKSLYAKAKLFWSAAGFGIDEKKEPEKVEHFGITVAEAMAAGAVPLVFNAGGHKEVVTDGQSGFLWKSKPELIKRTRELVGNKLLLGSMSEKALNECQKFAYERFAEEVSKII